MINRLKKAIIYPFKCILARMYPVKYARLIGVKMSSDRVFIYGSSLIMFSTEPWLISLGENVHITSNVRSITHDSVVP
jgi:hypothetical protein